MQRCGECGHKMFNETKYASWLKLFYFVNMLESEQMIKEFTAEDMRDSLMDFKTYAVDETFETETKAP